MKYELFLTGIVFIALGIEPFIYFIYRFYRKRTWRVCFIEKITLVSLQDLMPFSTFKDKQMLVEYGFEQKQLSAITDFDKKLFKQSQNKEQNCQIYVDPINPKNIFLPKHINKIPGVILPILGLFFIFLS
ncbi:hypothetical protein [Pseudoalteromonas denitrificans]|uniref:DUF3592 domain-containing protein n=1 Tax=Pseudoalteromonas denitrificans DSM 6059 TaxID=1123010 RepID=A0A1I1DTD3_9GAMM|nr:hypothetical protein [Pseudoalteromonas denitrificans]SFB77682.1 hypothetical protein SAMN02745724_00027 [Pseudoalteromonas denitrificans DSM 6059]